MNIGASKPEDNGDYFAWGETTGYTLDTSDGHSFSLGTYKWYSTSSSLTKYCTKADNGDVDNLTELELSGDAAYVNWGKNWRMPTIDQLTELKGKCTWTWVTQNGMVGYRLNGPNGKSLFLPAAGDRYRTSLENAGSCGLYWSRSLTTSLPLNARLLDFNSTGDVNLGHGSRYYGLSVRPVRVSQ